MSVFSITYFPISINCGSIVYHSYMVKNFTFLFSHNLPLSPGRTTRSHTTLSLKKCSDVPIIDILYVTPLLSLVSVKLLVEPPLTLTLPLLPPVKEILYPVVSPSGLGGVQVNRILVLSSPITKVKSLGAEATEGQQHAKGNVTEYELPYLVQ